MASLSPNVKAHLRQWDMRKEMELAMELTGQTVPQVSVDDSSNMLYQMPAGLKMHLTIDIAKAIARGQW